jgi:hypothetical protein
LPMGCSLSAPKDAVAGEGPAAARQARMREQAEALRRRLAHTHPEAERLRLELADCGNEALWRARLSPNAFRDWNRAFIRNGPSAERAAVAIRSLRAFQEELRSRGTELIVLPVPDHAMVYGHHILTNAPPELEFLPGYTEILLALLEADIEVVDVLDAFRQQAARDLQRPEPVPVMRYDDHHWASGGMGLAAELLAERLRRYPWAASLPPGTGHFSLRPAAPWDGRIPALEVVYDGPLPEAENTIRKAAGEELAWSEWPHPILLMGDSMIYHMAGTGKRWRITVGTGQEFPHHLSAKMGSLIPFRGRADGGRRVPLDYLQRHPKAETEPPKVLVWVASAFHLTESDWPSIDSLPTPDVAVHGQQRCKLEVLRVPPAPDPVRAPYGDALALVEAKVVQGPGEGSVIGLGLWAMRDRQLSAAFSGLHDGDLLDTDVLSFEDYEKLHAELSGVMLLDATEDPAALRYWWLVDGP